VAALTVFGAVTTANAAGPKACVVYACTDTSATGDIKTKLEASKLFDSVTMVDAGYTAPADATLAKCDSVLVFGDVNKGGFSDSTGVGDALARYIDKGGGVVMALPFYGGYYYNSPTGTNWSKYQLIDNSSSMSYVSRKSLGTKDTHAVLTGITKVDTNGSTCRERSSVTGSTVRSGAKIVATWNDGNGMVITGFPGGRPRIDLNLYPVSSDIGYYGCYDSAGDAAKLIAQSLQYVASPLRSNPSPADFGEVPVLGSADLSVEVENQGTAAITIASGDVTPAGVFTVEAIAYPKTLLPGDKLTLKVTAKPTAAGQATAIYSMTPSTPGAAPGVVQLIVKGIGPRYDAQPAQIDFGGIPVGSSASNVTVAITNTGGGYLGFNGATVDDGTNFALESVPAATLLGAGAGVTFEVKFKPALEKAYTTNVRVAYSIAGVNYSGIVSVKGSYGRPVIVAPASLVLSPVRVGATGPEQTITVQNTGNADLSITNLQFIGGDLGDFAVVTAASAMSPFKVLTASTGDIKVQCKPTVQALRQSTLEITSNDSAKPMGKVNVSVSCRGTVANFEMSVDKIDFTTKQQTGTCSSAQYVTVKNTGTDALKILSLGFTGANASSFKQTAPATRTVPGGGGTFVIPVQFCPVDIGSQKADLEIATDFKPGHVAKVPLTGTSTGPKVVVTPGQIDFGAVYIKTTSMSKQIQITNEGDQDLVFGKSILTPATGAFKVSGLPSEGKILKKGDPAITLDVQAGPLTAIQQSGEISIVVNDLVKMGNLRIPLSVTGVQADLKVDPMMMTFPLTIIGLRSQEQTVTVTNTGAAKLTGLDLSISGTASSDYVVTGDRTVVLDPGASAPFKVAFKPTGNGTRSAILVVNASGLTSPTQVKLEGTGKLLTISCSPDDKNLGMVRMGESAALKVICRNSDASDIEFQTGFSENQDDWSADPPSGTLPAGTPTEEGLVTLNVTFKPTATGPRTTVMTIKTKDGLAIGSINLDGTGLPMAKEKPSVEETGCSASGRPTTPAGTLIMLLLGAGTLLLHRRRRAYFSRRDAYFRDAYFRDAYFCDAYFRDAYFCDAYFRDAYFCDAYFRDAYFRDAYFRDAYFRDAYFRHARAYFSRCRAYFSRCRAYFSRCRAYFSRPAYF